MKRIRLFFISILPAYTITRMAGFFARRQFGFITRFVIKRFIKSYGVNMDEAQLSDLRSFPTFNCFFTRLLKPSKRPIHNDPKVIVSPVDGAVGECGVIRSGVLMQAKGQYYDLSALLAHDHAETAHFQNGHYVTAYLSPKDYHRVHIPLDGELISMTYVPGRLFSVQPLVIDHVGSVFARNERVVCIFNTLMGRVAVIFVGAMIVGSVVTSWHGEVRPGSSGITHWEYSSNQHRFTKGDEIGYFQLGSTVIMLTQENQIEQLGVAAGDSLLMGSPIAIMRPN